RGGNPVSVTELSRTISVNKATTHTVLRMLQIRGYATQDPETRLFRRGPELWSLGVALTGTVNVVELARSELERVCRETNANGSLLRHLGYGDMQSLFQIGGAYDDRGMFRHTIAIPALDEHGILQRRSYVPFPSGAASVFLAWEDPAVVEQIYASRR